MKAESQAAPGGEMPSEDSTGTWARLDLVSALMHSFPLEHLCYFKLSVQQGKRMGNKKKITFHLQIIL